MWSLSMSRTTLSATGSRSFYLILTRKAVKIRMGGVTQ